MESKVRALLLLFSVLLFEDIAVNGAPDICQVCKRIEECAQFGEMTREQQQLWNEKFPCAGPGKFVASSIPGFSAVAKGDYVCCPGVQFWGINSHIIPIPQTSKGGKKSLYKEDFNYGYPICKPQNIPPIPDTGCCGVDLSDGDRLTDLEEFLQFSNSPRLKREADFEELGVTFEDRIAGGQETDLDQYPWMAYLTIQFFDGDEFNSYGCGGSLISSRFVVTAAHCMVNGDDQLVSVSVTLAEYDKRTFPRDCVVGNDLKPACIDNLEVGVEGVVIHPDFVEDYLINDIALVKLQELAPYSRSIRPICLPSINIDSPEYADLPLVTAGWGLNVSVQSDVKQFTTIHVVLKSKCQEHYNHLTEGHICASGKRTEDTCKGDSGGPLMMLFKGKYYLVGIVSGKTAAYHCGTPVPTLYSNVYNYLEWINYFVA